MQNNNILMFVCIIFGENRLTKFQFLKLYFDHKSITLHVYKNYMLYFFDMNTWLINNLCQNQYNFKKLRYRMQYRILSFQKYELCDNFIFVKMILK